MQCGLCVSARTTVLATMSASMPIDFSIVVMARPLPTKALRLLSCQPRFQWIDIPDPTIITDSSPHDVNGGDHGHS
jgi:hypothetical protein